MLNSVTTQSQIQTAIGRAHTFTCQFLSTEDLSGKLVRVNIGFYNSLGIPNTFQLYQGTYADGPLTYVGSNETGDLYEVELEILDNYNFFVHYKTLLTKNISGWLTDKSIDNSTALTNQGNLEGDMSIGVEVEADSAICDIPLLINGTCSDSDIEFILEDTDGNEVDGYVVGENLVVRMVSNSNTSISFGFYAGFYNESSIGNLQNFIDDTGLNYARIAGAVETVDAFSNTCFSAGLGFLNQSNEFRAQVTIDNSCLEEGNCYRFYAVYREGGQWKMCISEPICAKSQPIPAIYGDIDCELIDIADQTHSGVCCFTNVSPYGDLQLCIEMDATSYATRLAAQSLGGTIFTRFIEATADLDGVGLNVISTLEAGGIKACATISDYTLEGLKTLTITFKFQMDGYFDYISVPVSIGFTQGTTESAIIVYDGATALTDIICAETAGDVTLTLPDANCIAVLTQDGVPINLNNLSYSGTTLTIDTSVLAIGNEYCIRIFCTDPINNDNEDCICPECPDTPFNFLVLNGAAPNEYTFEVNILSGTDLGTVMLSELETATSDSGIGTASLSINTTPYRELYFTINYTDVNGCEYVKYLVQDRDDFYPISGGYALLDKLTITEPSCDCDEPLDCTHNPTLTYDCDPDTGIISNIVLGGTFEEAPDTDEQLASTDGVNYAAIGASYQDSVHIIRRLTFPNCVPVELNETIVCDQITQCQNTKVMICEIINNQLNFTEIDNFASPVASQYLYLTINDKEYDPIDLSGGFTPIELTEGDEQIEWRVVVKFSDECPDLDIQGECSNDQTDDPPTTQECNTLYNNLSIDLTYNEGSGSWSATFNGDTSGFTLNDMLYSTDGTMPNIPYTGSVQTNIIGVAWMVQAPGCPPHCIFAYGVSPQQIEIINNNAFPDCLKVEIVEDCDDCEDAPPTGDPTNIAGK